jgi:hypothetical protein
VVEIKFLVTLGARAMAYLTSGQKYGHLKKCNNFLKVDK